ncbi:hypothetical protein ACFW9O_24905 [Streptomyces sp. NPDC059499]|uniref:hypothetical protein n=1 Tax=Streptomyces sp. NPDC059499 TaxID=3346852 RepID=UPI003688BB6C
MTGLFISIMRTLVPLVAGWVISLALWAGIDVDSQQVVTAVTVLLAVAYYALFRVLELLGQRARGDLLQRLAGFALGWARPPAYVADDPMATTYRGPVGT